MKKRTLINWVITFVLSCLLTLTVGLHGFAQSSIIPQPANVTAGIEAFDEGRFSDAIARWQTTLTRLSSSQTQPLTRAYLLSNIANAYRRLGQFTEAQRNLAQSLTIIESWPQQNQAYWQVSARVLKTPQAKS